MSKSKAELVKYSNDLNEVQLHKLTAMDLNFLYMICARVADKQDDVITIPYDEIRTAVGYTAHGGDHMESDLRRMNRKLLQCTGHYETSDEVVDFVLFSTFSLSKANQQLKIRVNPDFAYLLNHVAREFTAFELREFVSLDSKYGKGLYRLLKQWRTQGHTKQYSVDEIKRLLDTPDYATKDLTRYIINPAVEDITDHKLFPGLSCEIVRGSGRGRPTKGYIFRFRAEKPSRKAVTDKSEGNGSAAFRRGSKKKGFTDMEQTQDYDVDGIERALIGE